MAADVLPRPARPRGARTAGIVVVLLLALVAAAAPTPVPAAAQDGASIVVRDVHPAPASVLDAGPAVVAARVEGGGQQVAFLVDGRPVRTPAPDPDGDLTRLRGVTADLAPGRHVIEVVGDGEGVLRRWEVQASGLEVSTVDDPAGTLAARLRPPGRDVVVVADPAREDLAVALPLLLRDGAHLVALRGGRLPDGWAPRASGDGARALVLGGPDVVAPAVVDALALALGGDAVSRIDAADAPSAVLAAERTTDRDAPAPASADAPLVIGPTDPPAAALRTTVAAALLDAPAALVGPAGPDPATAARIADARTALLATDLGAEARQAVVDALAPGAVASDDALLPGGAAEAVVVADQVDAVRAAQAAAAADPGRPVLLGLSDARRWVAANRPDRVTVVVPPPPAPSAVPVSLLPAVAALPALAQLPALDPDAAAAPPPLTGAGDALVATPEAVAAAVDALHRAWVDGTGAPAVQLDVRAAGEGLTVLLDADAPVIDATVHVDLLGYEWPGRLERRGRTATWTAGPRPALPLPLEPGGPGSPTPARVTAVVTTGDGRRHLATTATVGLDPRDTTSPEGWVVAGGSGPQVGEGRVRTYSVEVEPATGLDIREVEAEVSRILSDPRSWTAGGDVAFRRVGTSRARLRVVVATPATVDAMCGAVGLRTGGRVSCWDGYRAMLNLDRWQTGVPPFHADLDVYREYLVNHEVGHGLGHGHVLCTQPGALAPVMVQQTGGIGACRANGWPFPSAGPASVPSTG